MYLESHRHRLFELQNPGNLEQNKPTTLLFDLDAVCTFRFIKMTEDKRERFQKVQEVKKSTRACYESLQADTKSQETFY